ncbi:MAG: methyltransferase domain-containing protein [Verrucomicrobia bacterium]|nr:methyltransferase domain-containing protein [Verrucomicrobiota bacterium]MBS0636641.1 methyltransferase domain-containing protein [Verrucomicrobiota bacterium]
MHLNSIPPEPFTTIASLPSHEIHNKPCFKPVPADAEIRRIKKLFLKSGLMELFSRSKRRINIVSLGCGTSRELPIIKKYSQKFGFTYRYFGLDISSEVFHERSNQRCSQGANKSDTFHIVDASDLSCLVQEVPILGEEKSVDAVLVLQPDIEDEPYPFWKMFLEVIPRLVKPDGLVVSSFFMHPEVVKFHAFTQAEAMQCIFKSVVCDVTEPIEDYTFASQHQWFAVATLRSDIPPTPLNPQLLELFHRIVAAPSGDCYTLEELSALKEDKIIKAVEKAREDSLRIQKWAETERRNSKPPKQMFIYENCDWYKKLYQ